MLITSLFIFLQVLVSGSRIAQKGYGSAIGSKVVHMLGELLNIPTGTLFDMLFVLLGSGIVLTANDVAEIEQIQRELQRRGEGN